MKTKIALIMFVLIILLSSCTSDKQELSPADDPNSSFFIPEGFDVGTIISAESFSVDSLTYTSVQTDKFAFVIYGTPIIRIGQEIKIITNAWPYYPGRNCMKYVDEQFTLNRCWIVYQ